MTNLRKIASVLSLALTFVSCSKDIIFPKPTPGDRINNIYHIVVREDKPQYVTKLKYDGTITGWSTEFNDPDFQYIPSDSGSIVIKRQDGRLHERSIYRGHGVDSLLIQNVIVEYNLEQKVSKIWYYELSPNDSLQLKMCYSFTHFKNNTGYKKTFIYFNIPGYSGPNSDYSESYYGDSLKAKIDINWLGRDEYGLKPDFLQQHYVYGGRGGPGAIWSQREYHYVLNDDGYVTKRKILEYNSDRFQVNGDTTITVDSFSYTFLK